MEEDEERRRREATLQGSASMPGSSGDVAVDTLAPGEQLQRDGPLAEGSQPGRVRKAPGIDTPQGRALSILPTAGIWHEQMRCQVQRRDGLSSAI